MEVHTMTITQDHEGTEQWTCPVCGRILLIEWEPWRKVVVEPGDDTVQHSGGKGGLIVNGIEINP